MRIRNTTSSQDRVGIALIEQQKLEAISDLLTYFRVEHGISRMNDQLLEIDAPLGQAAKAREIVLFDEVCDLVDRSCVHLRDAESALEATLRTDVISWHAHKLFLELTEDFARTRTILRAELKLLTKLDSDEVPFRDWRKMR